MSKYIGTPVVSLSTDTVDVTGDITTTDATPEVIIVNDTHEDTDGGREGKVTFKGQQSGGEETTLAEIQASHDGTSDDEKGDLIFRTNDGSDGTSPTERLKIDSNGSILTASLGTDNVHLGEGAGNSIASGGNLNTLIGKDAGTAITTGTDNTFVGSNAGDALIDSDHNVAIGHQSLTADTKGSKSVAVGAFSLNAQNFSSATDSHNTAVGYVSGAAITTGTDNTLIGSEVGDALTTGSLNTAIGKKALGADTKGNRSIAIGRFALGTQNHTSSTDTYNIAIGYSAGGAMTTGIKNSIVGGLAGDALTTGFNNTVMGYDALGSNTASGAHVAIGYEALATMNSATNTSQFNVAVGTQAGKLVTTGTYNTLIGPQAGFNITTGSKNTILGQFDGNAHSLDIRTDSNNIVLSDGDGQPRARFSSGGQMTLGVQGGDPFTDLSSSGNILTMGFGAAFGHNAQVFNTGGFTGPYDLVIFRNGNGIIGTIGINGSATSYATSSDYRLKENVTDISDGITRIKQLAPKRFNFIADADTTVDGFLAHEAQTVVPEAITGTKDAVEVWKDGDELPDGVSVGDSKLDDDGKTIPVMQGIDQSKIVPLLTAALQEAIAKIETLETKVAALEGE